ncbi:MAG: hypothetical protein AB6733_13720 [Clostridiaceae bacterium]
MKRKIYSTSIIMLLFSCSILLTSCSAITAQNITNKGSNQGMNGVPAMNDNQRANGNANDNGNFKGGMASANLMGKIVSVDGNSIKIEVVEQTGNNTAEVKSTGIEKTIEIGDGVNISQGMMGMQRQNNNSQGSIKVSDLKKDKIIMIWYKESTETVERISVVQS